MGISIEGTREAMKGMTKTELHDLKKGLEAMKGVKKLKDAWDWTMLFILIDYADEIIAIHDTENLNCRDEKLDAGTLGNADCDRCESKVFCQGARV